MHNDEQTQRELELAARHVRITETSRRVFMAYAKDAGNWSGTPLIGGNVGGTKEEQGNLTQLKQAGLITTHEEHEKGQGIYIWITFTDLGKAYARANGFDIDEGEEIAIPPIDPDSQLGKSLIHDFGEFRNWPGTQPTEEEIEAYVTDYGDYIHMLDISSVGLDRIRTLLRTLITEQGDPFQVGVRVQVIKRPADTSIPADVVGRAGRIVKRNEAGPPMDSADGAPMWRADIDVEFESGTGIVDNTWSFELPTDELRVIPDDWDGDPVADPDADYAVHAQAIPLVRTYLDADLAVVQHATNPERYGDRGWWERENERLDEAKALAQTELEAFCEDKLLLGKPRDLDGEDDKPPTFLDALRKWYLIVWAQIAIDCDALQHERDRTEETLVWILDRIAPRKQGGAR